MRRIGAKSHERDKQLAVGLLGPLSVTVGGREVVISGARRRDVLIRLVLNAGHPMESGRLLESVWEGDAPAGAANSLQAHVGYLRRQLGGGRRADGGSGVSPRHGRGDGRLGGVRAGGGGRAGRARRAASGRGGRAGAFGAGPVAGAGADRCGRSFVGAGRDRPVDGAARSGPRAVAPGVAGDRAVRRGGGGR